jgi:CRISPR type I-D-associated protein Csc3/Cas10d
MSKNTETLILKLLEDETAEQQSPRLMEFLLNRGIQTMPDILQTGDKQQQSLKAHTQNVMCFCYQLADILEIDDTQKMNLITAAFLHDINKFDTYNNMSYKDVATLDNINNHLKSLFDQWEVSFDLTTTIIQDIMLGHSGHLHHRSSGLEANAQNFENQQLISIIQAADTLDISHYFHEQDKKHQALRLINQHIHDFQFDYTWHYFSDNRGLYTNFIHNVIVTEYQKQGAIPLLFYPEGVWYLKNRNHDILIEPETIALRIQQEMDVLSGQDLSKLVKDAKGTAFKYNKNPFALNLSPEAIMDIFVNAIVTPKDKKYVDKYSKLITDDCLPKLMKSLDKEKSSIHQKKVTAEKQYQNVLSKNNLSESWSTSDDDYQRLTKSIKKRITNLKQKITDLNKTSQSLAAIHFQENPESLFNSEIEVMHMGMLVGSFAYLLNNFVTINESAIDSSKAWDLSLEAAGLEPDAYPELVAFDKQSNRAFRTATIFYKLGIDFVGLKQKYLDYLNTLNLNDLYASANEMDPLLIDYVKTNFQTNKMPLTIDTHQIKKYMSGNHSQCSHCSSGQGGELMAGGLPKGIKPQLFSNRLKGGGGEPKRNVCTLCNQGFFLEKICHESYDHHYYLHLFADGGEHRSHAAPNIFLESLKNGIRALYHTDFRSFLIQPNAVVKNYLDNKNPNLEGSAKKGWGILIPKFSQSICGQITIGINPPGGKETNEGVKFIFAFFHLLMFTDYFHLRGILSRSSIPPLKANEFDCLYIDHIPLAFGALIPSNNISASSMIQLKQKFFALYALRNSYGMDDKELYKLSKSLFDSSGLELIYHLKKAFAGTERTREKPPWKWLWPYIQLFIEEEKLMPIKQLAEIALKYHFHGHSFKETSQAKPIDLAFDAISKHRAPESKKDLKMVMLHDVSRGLERLSPFGQLNKDRYDAVHEFVSVFFDQIFMQQYKGDKVRIMQMQKRIRAAFIGYLNVIRKNNNKEKE